MGAKRKKLGKYVEVKEKKGKGRTINLSRAQYELAMQHKNSYSVFLVDMSQTPTKYYLIPIARIGRLPDSHLYTFRAYDLEKYFIKKGK